MEYSRKNEQTNCIRWVCPRDQKPLNDTGPNLTCPDGHSFPRTKEIPRFVHNANYSDAFGEQWKKYRLTQLDSYTGTAITKDRVIRVMGDDYKNILTGKHVLECGCGAGRFTEFLLNEGAYVTSIDLSEAVEANQENFPQDNTHRIAQADIMEFPFEPQQFDVVFCLGVVQHTPNPEATIASLYNQVKPGGMLVIDHYTYGLSWYTKTAPLFRRYLRRLPPKEGLRWTERLVDTLLPLHKRVRHFRIAQMLLSRLSPVQSYYHSYPELSDQQLREWALLDTHDYLTDWYKHFRTRGQIQRTFERLGLQEISCVYAGNGVEARGKRPL